VEPRIMGVTEAVRNFRSVIDDVVDSQRSVVLIRDSRPQAVLITYEAYARFQRLQEERERDVLSRFDRLVAKMASRHGDFSDDEVAADVEIARQEVADLVQGKVGSR